MGGGRAGGGGRARGGHRRVKARLATGGGVIKIVPTSICTCSITAMIVYNIIFEHVPMEVGTVTA